MLPRIAFPRLVAGLGTLGTATGIVLAISTAPASAAQTAGNYQCSGTTACVAGSFNCTVSCGSKCSCTNWQ
jgi:hypothetical protein